MSQETINNPFDTVSSLLRQSLVQRTEVAEDVKKHIPELITALVECSLGAWKESVQITRKGEARVKVYQVSPDVKAINALLRLCNMEPEEMSGVLLNMSRIRSIEAEIEARVADRKAENLASQTYLNNKNADAFAASFVVEEDVQGAALAVATACIGYIQTMPFEIMQQNCKDQSTYQQFQLKIAEVVWEAYGEKVGVSDKPELESGDDEDTEEDEE